MIRASDTSGRQRVSQTRSSWLILVIFVLLALALTWPILGVIAQRMPGTATWAFDESTFAWNIWYFRHAVLDLQTNPLHTELIWYPLGIDLVLYTYNFFNALIALPLQIAFNLPLASNVALLAATVLSGFGAYLLALYVLSTAFFREARKLAVLRAAALLAGIIYAFASNRAVYAALGHYDMVTTQWLPFFALYLMRTLQKPGIKNPVLAGLFFGLAALAEMIFASFLALFSLIAAVLIIPRLAQRWAAVRRLVIAGVVALLIWSPALLPIARAFTTGDYALAGWGESVKLSADLVGLLTPTALNPLAHQREPDGSDWAAALRLVEEGKARFGDVNTVFLGYVTLGLAFLGVWHGRRKLAVWTWSALVFGVLALGPLLQINGQFRFSLDELLPEGATFPLPFALLHFIPLVNANRAPNRNSAILMLALAVLAASGATWLLSRLDHRWGREASAAGRPGMRRAPRAAVAAVLVAGVIAEHLAVPLPTTDARIPEVYRRIAQELGDFAIMQLPLGWRNSFGVLGSEQTQLQYFQTEHGKPMLGGNISRAPDYKMEYFARIPLFRALTGLEMYQEPSPETEAAARAQAGDLMSLYNIRYLITTPPIPGRYPYQDTWQRTEAFALDVLPLEQPPVWESDGYRVYRVIQPPIPSTFRLDLGAPGAEPYVGGGWDLGTDEQPYGQTAIWATDTTADLYLPLSEPAGVTLRLNIAPLTYEGAPQQTLAIHVNGVPVTADGTRGSLGLAPGWQTIEARVPAAATRRGPNRVRLTFAWADSPRQVFPDATSRAVIGSTGQVSPVNVDVHSFDEAFISLMGPDGTETNGSAGRRGYNVAVIDPRTGRLLDMQGFDTAANSYEADALAAYLAGIRPGRIVILATKEDATAHLSDAAVSALRGLGSRVQSPGELSGQAHALIGIQGAPPGTAAEAIAPGDAFVRVAGDFRTLAAALDWAELAR